MSGRKLKLYTAIFAAFCFVLLVASGVSVVYFAVKAGAAQTVQAAIGLAVGFIFAPIIHELGHVCFAKAQDMRPVYVKCFCFRYARNNGVKTFTLANPFTPDETQVLPNRSGDMKKRALWYARGGLIFSVIAIAALILCACIGGGRYFFLGALTYTVYLALLNLAPLPYANGKTDTAVCRGIKRGGDEEKTWLAAMEIQGKLCQGSSFAQIEERLYYDLPQLCEDSPLFATIQDLRYRYRLEKGEIDAAAKELNRLAQAQPYLSDNNLGKVCAELVYMHALRGDREGAEANGKFCRAYLQSSSVTAKRILAAFAAAFGKTDEASLLKQAALDGLKKEEIKGIAAFEEILLSRIVAE